MIYFPSKAQMIEHRVALRRFTSEARKKQKRGLLDELQSIAAVLSRVGADSYRCLLKSAFVEDC
jgi:hypothetical protein